MSIFLGRIQVGQYKKHFALLLELHIMEWTFLILELLTQQDWSCTPPAAGGLQVRILSHSPNISNAQYAMRRLSITHNMEYFAAKS
jgi:hypothetical protein